MRKGLGREMRKDRSSGIINVILFIKSCDQISRPDKITTELVKVIKIIFCTTPILHITYIAIGVASGKIMSNALAFTPANVIW